MLPGGQNSAAVDICPGVGRCTGRVTAIRLAGLLLTDAHGVRRDRRALRHRRKFARSLVMVCQVLLFVGWPCFAQVAESRW
jgi:hypothetical protein